MAKNERRYNTLSEIISVSSEDTMKLKIRDEWILRLPVGTSYKIDEEFDNGIPGVSLTGSRKPLVMRCSGPVMKQPEELALSEHFDVFGKYYSVIDCRYDNRAQSNDSGFTQKIFSDRDDLYVDVISENIFPFGSSVQIRVRGEDLVPFNFESQISRRSVSEQQSVLKLFETIASSICLNEIEEAKDYQETVYRKTTNTNNKNEKKIIPKDPNFIFEGTVLIKYIGKSNRISIPNGVTEIADNTFSGTGLLSVTVPEGVETIGSRVFENCFELETVELPSSISEIGGYCFVDCHKLKKISLGNKLKIIDNSAFSDCRELENVMIPDSVEHILPFAFKGCTSFTRITIPEGVKFIGFTAFAFCRNLSYLYIPGSVIQIDDNMMGQTPFYNCEKLVIHCPSGSYAEDYCRSHGIKYETEGATVNVSYKAGTEKSDKGSANLASPVYKVINAQFWLPKTWAMVKEKDCEISYGELKKYKGRAKSLVLPEAFSEISTDLFYNSDINAVFIPDGVTKIGNDAFWRCQSLKTVLLPDSISEIGSSAFRMCEELTTFIIPDGCTDIGDDCFTSCKKLKDVYIPDSVDYIGDDAFFTMNDAMVLHVERGSYAEEYAKENDIKYDYKSAPDIESIRKQVIDDLEAKKKASQENKAEKKRIQTESRINEITNNVESAKATLTDEIETDRAQFKIVKNEIRKFIGDSEKVVIPSGITSIGNEAFKNKKNVIAVKFPDSVQSIGISAFEKCENLCYVDIPDSVQTIGYNAFKGCKSLLSVRIPKDMKTISGFSDCENLNEVIINDSAHIIDGFAFSNCKRLTSLVIPESIRQIRHYAFSGCKSLESIEILGPLKTVSENMFSGCESLKTVHLPDSVTTIERNAFDNCKELERIVLPRSIKELGDSVFYNCVKLTEIVVPEGVTELNIGNHILLLLNIKKLYLPESLEKIKNLEEMKGHVEQVIVYKDSYAEKVVKELKMKHKSVQTEKQKEEERLKKEKAELEDRLKKCELEVGVLRTEINRSALEVHVRTAEYTKKRDAFEQRTANRKDEEAEIERKCQEEDIRLNSLLQELKDKKDDLMKQRTDKESELSKAFFLAFSKKKKLGDEISTIERNIFMNEKEQSDTADKIRINLKKRDDSLKKIDNDISQAEKELSDLKNEIDRLEMEDKRNKNTLTEKEKKLITMRDDLKKYQ